MSSKSTFSNSTSISYALALYELAKENSELIKVEEEMKSIDKIIIIVDGQLRQAIITIVICTTYNNGMGFVDRTNGLNHITLYRIPKIMRNPMRLV